MTSTKSGAAKTSEFGIDVAVKHKRLQEAHESLQFLIDHGKGFELLTLVGGTGAGKSLLIEKLFEHLMSREREEMERDADYVPAVVTKAWHSGYRAFDWKSLYRDASKAVGDPFAWMRRPDREADLKRTRFGGEPPTITGYRRSMQAEFEYRRTKYWFIDEAQHILTGAKAGGPADQFDVLKSVAQTSRVKIILVGPHSLLTHVDCSAQLARRTNCVQLHRYHVTHEGDMDDFASCVAAFLTRLPLTSYPDVEENIDFYYAGSTGCVGILKEWCERAAEYMWRAGGGRALTLEHLRATRLRKSALEKIWSELLEGELLLKEGDDPEFGALEAQTRVRLTPGPGTPSRKAEARKPEKPGIRNPTRDPVPPVLGATR